MHETQRRFADVQDTVVELMYETQRRFWCPRHIVGVLMYETQSGFVDVQCTRHGVVC